MSALGWGDLGNVVPIGGFDKEALKREIPLEWVMAQYGGEMTPDTSGTRLEGVCPFGQHTGRKFTVRETETGERVAGCWACPDKWQGDLFELLGWLTGETDFGKVLQIAHVMAQRFRADDAWAARPPIVLKPAPKQDPAILTADAAVGIRTAVADPRLIKELIERKAATDPGWRRLTPEFLISSWQVGAEPDRVEQHGLSNPDSTAYPSQARVVTGSRVLVPHWSWDAQSGNWLVRGLKTRNARYGHLIAASGSDLKGALYGIWRMRGLDTVLVCEGEGDAWCASAVPEITAQMDVVSVPAGVKGAPTEQLLAPLRGKNVVLAFDGDTDGKAWTAKWVEALRDVAASILVAPVPDGLDLASCPDLTPVVLGAVAVKPALDPSAAAEAAGASVTATGSAVGSGGIQHADDIANAGLFVQQHGHRLRWAPARKQWLVYTGARWIPDAGDAATRAAVETARSLFEMRLERFREGSASEGELEGLLKRAKDAGNRARINAMLEIGRAYLVVPEADLDADLWSLNCLNGTLDLHTGELRPHNPDDLITRLAPVEWDPAAHSERWEYFLSTTIPDPAERAFLQRMAGSFLPGVNTDEKFFVLQGDGGSGKSTFTEALAAAIGDYATSADVEMFLRSQRPRTAQEANPAMAALVGRRLVMSPEPPKGRQWDEGLIKRLTGGDTMTTREMYGRNFDFKPTFSLVVMANLRTAADGDAGGGMARRLLEVPFPVARGGKGDPTVKKELIDASVSGAAVLAWTVAGCLAWQQQGLAVPDSVRAATEEYWKEQLEGDPVVSFLADYYDVTGSDEDRVTRAQLFEHFKTATHSKWSRRAFNERMREIGGEVGVWERKSGNYDYYCGLKTKTPPNWEDFKDIAPVTDSTN